ncbi:hypothetical protein SISSUDRAFT_1041138 [Sistotremastrum suecicum HHB10207 ss-3]|uniref:Uncharacterized protein n=1 Tax=Sistotremastrum suecicum HHB10207 ss-3 TaxID=1314776 RepID=A0A166HM12_9AGAM|nr:hypothetical protein SISSUDRAFT_1041138 [Sistotremastrum suecicum HHB10207 ss-3]
MAVQHSAHSSIGPSIGAWCQTDNHSLMRTRTCPTTLDMLVWKTRRYALLTALNLLLAVFMTILLVVLFLISPFFECMKLVGKREDASAQVRDTTTVTEVQALLRRIPGAFISKPVSMLSSSSMHTVPTDPPPSPSPFQIRSRISIPSSASADSDERRFSDLRDASKLSFWLIDKLSAVVGWVFPDIKHLFLDRPESDSQDSLRVDINALITTTPTRTSSPPRPISHTPVTPPSSKKLATPDRKRKLRRTALRRLADLEYCKASFLRTNVAYNTNISLKEERLRNLITQIRSNDQPELRKKFLKARIEERMHDLEKTKENRRIHQKKLQGLSKDLASFRSSFDPGPQYSFLYLQDTASLVTGVRQPLNIPKREVFLCTCDLARPIVSRRPYPMLKEPSLPLRGRNMNIPSDVPVVGKGLKRKASVSRGYPNCRRCSQSRSRTVSGP